MGFRRSGAFFLCAVVKMGAALDLCPFVPLAGHSAFAKVPCSCILRMRAKGLASELVAHSNSWCERFCGSNVLRHALLVSNLHQYNRAGCAGTSLSSRRFASHLCPRTASHASRACSGTWHSSSRSVASLLPGPAVQQPATWSTRLS